MRRRTFLAGASAGIGLACSGGPSSTPSPKPTEPHPGPPADRPDFQVDVEIDEAMSDEELDAIHLGLATIEAGKAPEIGTATYQEWTDNAALRRRIRNDRVLPHIGSGPDRLAPVVFGDAESADYAHLAHEAASAGSFALTHDVLESICERDHFRETFGRPLAGQTVAPDIVIFGLRGCEVVDRRTAAYPQAAVELREQAVDHLHRRCVIGVWQRKRKLVSALSASTVPHMSYMQLHRIHLHLLGRLHLTDPTFGADDVVSDKMKKEAKFVGWRANQLGQGLHLMTIGTHHASGKAYPGLPKQNLQWYGPVLRAEREPGFRVGDWDPGSGAVHDNIHPAWRFRPDGTHFVDFASAGCTTVHGGGGGGRDYWGSIAALRHDIRRGGSLKEGDHYLYLLVSGREARLHAQGRGPERWRFGSSGPEIERIQRAVGVEETGLFDRDTHYAVVTWQRGEQQTPDGVVRSEAFPS